MWAESGEVYLSCCPVGDGERKCEGNIDNNGKVGIENLGNIAGRVQYRNQKPSRCTIACVSSTWSIFLMEINHRPSLEAESRVYFIRNRSCPRKDKIAR